MGDVVSLITQFVPVGRTEVLGEMPGWIAPVGASVDPGSDGFVPTTGLGGLLDLSAEGIPAGDRPGNRAFPDGYPTETAFEPAAGQSTLVQASVVLRMARLSVIFIANT